MTNTVASAADNHLYRINTLQSIREIFTAPEPGLNEKEREVWADTICSAINEYFNIIFPQGLKVSFLNKDGTAIEDGHRIALYPRFEQDKEFSNQINSVQPLHAHDLKSSFQIRTDIKIAYDEYIHYRYTMPIHIDCAAKSNKKFTQHRYTFNLVFLTAVIDQRLHAEICTLKKMQPDIHIPGSVYHEIISNDEWKGARMRFLPIYNLATTTDRHEIRQELMDAVEKGLRLLGRQFLQYQNTSLFFDQCKLLGFRVLEHETRYFKFRLHVPNNGNGLWDGYLFDIALNENGVDHVELIEMRHGNDKLRFAVNDFVKEKMSELFAFPEKLTLDFEQMTCPGGGGKAVIGMALKSMGEYGFKAQPVNCPVYGKVSECEVVRHEIFAWEDKPRQVYFILKTRENWGYDNEPEKYRLWFHVYLNEDGVERVVASDNPGVPDKEIPHEKEFCDYVKAHIEVLFGFASGR